MLIKNVIHLAKHILKSVLLTVSIFGCVRNEHLLASILANLVITKKIHYLKQRSIDELSYITSRQGNTNNNNNVFKRSKPHNRYR